MQIKKITLFVAGLFVYAYGYANNDVLAPEVEIRASSIDSRIMKYPATVETYDRQQIEDSVNAATPAQTMKYLPSIQVRERFIGDRNGIIATRTIGAISSAQSMLYADGVLLSNLLGNSYSYPPRWGMVSPEEIESISMMYGPFSSLYAGNSFGGVISIQTRMPEKFEAHANVQGFMQNFRLYGTDVMNRGNHESASVGNKINDFSFWLGVDRLENQGQPMDFSVSNLSVTNAGAQTVVTGAYQDKSEKNASRVVFGATSIDNSDQINTKVKATYDFTSQIKAAYTLGLWNADGKTDVQSYIKDANGTPIYNGDVSFNGKKYTVTALSPAKSENLHIMQALELKSNTKGFFDWQLTLSDYDYQKDLNGSSKITSGNPYVLRTGLVTDMSGTGWTVFDARGTLRPSNHTIDVGYHIDDYQLRSTTTNTSDWLAISKGTFNASSSGNTQTQALYVQDKWQLTPQWALTLGARQEFWQASEGRNESATSNPRVVNYQDKSESKFSPKISLSFEPQPAWGFRAAFGQAFRFPTVTELYQQLANGANILINNPELKPEEVLSAELTAERRFANGLVRVSAFNEHKYDALISQTNTVNIGTTTYVQNVDHIRTYGLEMATEWQNVMIFGLDIHANATWTDAKVLLDSAAPSNNGHVAPRIPKQLYKAVATYHVNNDFTLSVGARYSGRQYINLDNSDVNPDAYKAASQFFLMDVKANYKFSDRWMASVGVDNLTNYKAYVSHPLPQRTLYAQIKFDY